MDSAVALSAIEVKNVDVEFAAIWDRIGLIRDWIAGMAALRVVIWLRADVI